MSSLARAQAALAGERPAWLTVIQNFRASGGYHAVACEPNERAATDALLNSGQRHPGLVLRLTHANDRPPSSKVAEVPLLQRFDCRLGDHLVFVHQPVSPVDDRVEVVHHGRARGGAGSGRRAADAQPVLALVGEVLTIADGEMGSFNRYRQDRLNAVGRGLR